MVLDPSTDHNQTALELSVGSIMNQTYQNWELIVLTPTPNDYLNSLGDTRIKPMIGSPKMSKIDARLTALEFATGDYFVFHDPHVVSTPNRFEDQVNYFNKHPYLDMVGVGYTQLYTDGARDQTKSYAFG